MTLSLILYLYYFIVLIVLVFELICIYHLLISTPSSLLSFGVTVLVLALTAMTLLATWYLLAGVDWQTPLVTFSFKNFDRIPASL